MKLDEKTKETEWVNKRKIERKVKSKKIQTK